MIIPFIVGIIGSYLTVGTPQHKVGVAAWCMVSKDGTVQCNYDTKGECEGYREKTDICVQNPTPGQESWGVTESDKAGK